MKVASMVVTNATKRELFVAKWTMQGWELWFRMVRVMLLSPLSTCFRFEWSLGFRNWTIPCSSCWTPFTDSNPVEPNHNNVIFPTVWIWPSIYDFGRTSHYIHCNTAVTNTSPPLSGFFDTPPTAHGSRPTKTISLIIFGFLGTSVPISMKWVDDGQGF